MILNFIERSDIRRIVFLLICIIAFFGQKIIATPELSETAPCMPLTQFVNGIIEHNTTFSIIIKSALVLACIAVSLFISSKFDVLPQRKYIAVALFLAITSMFVSAQNLVDILFALLLHLLAAYQIFRTYRIDNIKSQIFIAAFLVGLSTLFFMQSASTLVCLIVGIWIFNVITGKNLLVLLVGFVTPFIFALCYYHLVLHDAALFFETISNNFQYLISEHPELKDIYFYISTGTVVLAVIISILKISRSLIPKVLHQKICLTFSFAFLVAGLISIAVPDKNFATLSLLSIPSAFLIAQFSLFLKRKRFADIMVIVIIAAAVVCNYQLIN